MPNERSGSKLQRETRHRNSDQLSENKQGLQPERSEDWRKEREGGRRREGRGGQGREGKGERTEKEDKGAREREG